MGEYVVNGEIVELRQDRPTAADLKREVGGQADDWVMVTTADGKIQKVEDGRPLPDGANDISIVPRYQYGC